MMRIAADLHIHTVLSPCASREMTPPAVAREAAGIGMALIAVCDHNSAGNVEAVAAAAAEIPGGPVVIPGIEITTAEEVHVLGFFQTLADAKRAGNEVAAELPSWLPPASRASAAPAQELMDDAGRVTGRETRMLAAASRFTLGQTVDLIHRNHGLAVAAHVDRRSFSVQSQLGFFPPDAAFDGLEISAAGAARGCTAEFAILGLPLISSSDSHFLADMGTAFTILEVQGPSFEELRAALLGKQGRGCAIA